MLSPDRASELLTVAEVANELRCSKAHLSNILAGRVRGCAPLPSVRLGRRTLIRRDSLLQWIQQSEHANDNLKASSERVNRIA